MLFEYLQDQGLSATDVLACPAPVLPPLGMGSYPLARWVELLNRAAHALDDPLLGLHLGQTVKPRHLGVVGYLCSTLPTLGEALQRLDQYQRLIYDPTPMQLNSRGEYMELTWDGEHGRPGNLADETAITALIAFTRMLSHSAPAPLLISFINPAAADVAAFEEYFKCPVLFDQKATVVRVSLSDMVHPLSTTDPAMQAVMEAQADKMLERLPQNNDFIATVRRHIGHLLHDADPSCDAVAKCMHLSRRSLQRKLTEQGSSFREELNTLRSQLACSYLRESNLRMADIAQLLGYAEQSVFSRSFQRWVGCAPQDYRAEQADLASSPVATS